MVGCAPPFILTLIKQNISVMKIIWRKIRNRLGNIYMAKKTSRLEVFSNSEKLEGICYEELIPLSFNNLVTIFISQLQLRKSGIKRLEDLNNKGITYCIILPNKKLYFGHTTDIGERFHTWTKDARSKNSLICRDLRQFGKALVVVYKIGTEKECQDCESQLIVKFKENIFYEVTGKNIYECSKREVKKVLSNYIYNVKNK